MPAVNINGAPQATTLPNWAAPRENVEVVRGNDYLLFNIIRNVAQIPAKLMFWNSSVASGNVSVDTIAKTVNFLEENNLEDVAVQVNDYSPTWYCGRVFSNPNTSLLSKVIFGPVSVIGNALGLEKIWGSDSYDVMSNSVYLSSDDADLGLFQAGRAKDFNASNMPVLYAMTPGLVSNIHPLLTNITQLYMSNNALNNAQTWAENKQTPAENARSYTTMASVAYLPVVTGAIASIGMLTAINTIQQMIIASIRDGVDFPFGDIAHLLAETYQNIALASVAACVLGHLAIRMKASTMENEKKSAA